MATTDARAVARFRAARHDPTLVVLEGLHAFKHAVRFGAEITAALSPDLARLRALARDLAADCLDAIDAATLLCSEATFEATAPRPPETCLIALARRPRVEPATVLSAAGPIILLDRPRHLGNLGAAIRVAAAAEAGGLIVLGDADPFHPVAVRGAAGLQFALPCARATALPHFGRPLVAFADDGMPLDDELAPAHAVLAFGSERGGLALALRERAERVVAIPMRAGVSSLNLATAVAIGLYAGRLGRGAHPGNEAGPMTSHRDG